jgi:hypothetical protein
MVKGWRPISIKETLVKRLETIRVKSKTDQEFGPWLNRLLNDYVEYNIKVQQYGQFIEGVNATDNRITMYDNRINKPISIFINGKRKELQCEEDQKIDCIHVGFCYAIPEIYQALIDHGFRPPRKG